MFIGKMFSSIYPYCSSLYLFPLDGGRRLGADIVGHPVDAPHFVDDPIRYPSQDLVGHVIPVRGHVVRRLHAADRAHLLVRSSGGREGAGKKSTRRRKHQE